MLGANHLKYSVESVALKHSACGCTTGLITGNKQSLSVKKEHNSLILQ